MLGPTLVSLLSSEHQKHDLGHVFVERFLFLVLFRPIATGLRVVLAAKEAAKEDCTMGFAVLELSLKRLVSQAQRRGLGCSHRSVNVEARSNASRISWFLPSSTRNALFKSPILFSASFPSR